jgi:predicted Fe-S protein YdhL (DUF1289 family)
MNVESPCVKICQLDTNMVCIGCKRTAEEISVWTIITDVERKHILENIKARLAQR